MADSHSPAAPSPPPRKELSSSHKAVRRGLALIAPPLLTLVVFLWVWSIIESNILVPMENAAKYLIVSATSQDVYYDRVPSEVEPREVFVKRAGQLTPLADQIDQPVTAADAVLLAERNELGQVYFQFHGKIFVPLGNRQWVNKSVFDTVNLDPGPSQLRTGRNYYDRYVELKYLQRWLVIPIFLSLFICFLYFIGMFLAAGIGRFLWNALESLVHRFPIIRNVYGSVKQISDFLLTEQEVTFMKVVAVEYPRRGIWSLGFVTGESMLDIRSAANEPVLAVLIPTSPMPATGFTMTVLKSETIDMNLTVDQMIQFCVSCGVVVPAHQQWSKSFPQLPPSTAPTASPENGDPHAGEQTQPRRATPSDGSDAPPSPSS